MPRTLITLILALSTVLAGCLAGAPGEDAPPETEPAEVQSALNESQPFRVAAEDASPQTAYPYRLGSGEPKNTTTRTFEGTFEPEDCGWRPVGGGDSLQRHAFTDALAPGDVFLARATLTFTNTDENWADMRVYLWIPGRGASYDDYAGEERGEVTQEIEAQSAWRGDSGREAVLAIGCWWGEMREPIAYTATVELTFVRDAAPVGVPVGLQVPADATHLHFSGKAIDPAEPVTAHWRLFDAQDGFVGEGFFGLTPGDPVTSVPVEAAGEYVLYVEHVENGFLAAAANVPPADPEIQLLAIDWVYEPVLQVDHGRDVDEVLTFNLPRMPLGLYAWTDVHEDGSTVVDNVAIDIASPLGTLLEMRQAGYVRAEDPVRFSFFLPSVNGEWAWSYDHHALSPGDHTLHLTADKFHGQVFYVMSTYLRSGESTAPAPDFGGSSGALGVDLGRI